MSNKQSAKKRRSLKITDARLQSWAKNPPEDRGPYFDTGGEGFAVRAGKRRKSPLGGDGWISSPERREAARSGRSPIAGERLLILKVVIQKSCGDRQAPTRSRHSQCAPRMSTHQSGHPPSGISRAL